MGYFHCDILTEVLVRLPVKSLIRFKCVSKQWDLLVLDSKFIRSHLKTFNSRDQDHHDFILHRFCLSPRFLALRIPSDLDSHEVFLQASVQTEAPPAPMISNYKKFSFHRTIECDGLLCIHCTHGLVVWNPSIKAYSKFPKPPEPDFIKEWGFGYDSSIEDYKVVNIRNTTKNGPLSIQCLRLKTGSWNTAQCNIQSNDTIVVGPEASQTVNGFIYWICVIMDIDKMSTVGSLLACFDLEKEILREETSPNDEIFHKTYCGLGLLEGSLCVMSFPSITGAEDYRHYDVWVMEENRGSTPTKTWKKLFRFPSSSRPLRAYYYSIYFTKNGLLLINEHTQLANDSDDSTEIFLYNLKDVSLKKIVVHGVGFGCWPHHFRMIPYTESLVLPGAASDPNLSWINLTTEPQYH